MKVRRFAAVALCVFGALSQLPGQALPGSETTPITGTDCTVGEADLSYDGSVGAWKGVANVVCATKKPLITLKFNVFGPINGVDTTSHPYVKGAVAFHSKDLSNGLDTYFCQDGVDNPCSSVQAHGSRNTSLPPGLYVLKATGTVSLASGTVRTGSHVNCYVVTADSTESVIEVEGCII